MDHLSPGAALAAVIKHQADSTVLNIGYSLAAVIEVVLVYWVWVESISLSSAEARSGAAAATAAAPTARLGLSRLGRCDWRQGGIGRTASYGKAMEEDQKSGNIPIMFYCYEMICGS